MNFDDVHIEKQIKNYFFTRITNEFANNRYRLHLYLVNTRFRFVSTEMMHKLFEY